MTEESATTLLHRCPWAERSPEERAYHDGEWGTPLHDEGRLFEFLILEGAQAGLSWVTILKKRERYRQVFDGFDPERIARYDEAKLAELLADPGIIRNRLKLTAAVVNAQSFLNLKESVGGFDQYLWNFVDGRPIQNVWRNMRDVPASTPLSDAMSKDLKRRGFKFVGSTICYAFMQAVGLVNDHLVDCFRWRELQ